MAASGKFTDVWKNAMDKKSGILERERKSSHCAQIGHVHKCSMNEDSAAL